MPACARIQAWRLRSRSCSARIADLGDAYAMRAGKAQSSCATVLRRAVGWGECAPGEPVAESALQHARAAQRQLAASNRTAEIGPSQVDAVERAGVDAHREVDVETGMLEAD